MFCLYQEMSSHAGLDSNVVIVTIENECEKWHVLEEKHSRSSIIFFRKGVVGTVSRLIQKVEILIFWWLKGAWNRSGKETVREKKKRCSKKAPIKNSLSFHDGAIRLNVYFTWQWFITRETKRFFPGLFDFATVWQIKNLWEIL